MSIVQDAKRRNRLRTEPDSFSFDTPEIKETAVLDRATAKALVTKQLTEKAPADDQWVVLDENTIERPFGWVFFYNSRKFIETGETMYRLAGNGPVIVNKRTGWIDFFGSLPTLDETIANYEAQFGAERSSPDN